jgi:hypothetical protein
MHPNIWFYNFIKGLLTIQAIEDTIILNEIENIVPIGNEISPNCIRYDEKTFTWYLHSKHPTTY